MASLAFTEEGGAGGPRYRVHDLPLPIDSAGSFPVLDFYLAGEPGRLVLSRDLASLNSDILDWVVASFDTWFEQRFWTRTVSSARGLVDQERDILRRLEAGLETIQRPELIIQRMSEIRKSKWLLAEFEEQLSAAQAALSEVVDLSARDDCGAETAPSRNSLKGIQSADRAEGTV